MPGGGRRLPRTGRTSVPLTVPLLPGDISASRYSALGIGIPSVPGLEKPKAPKHIPFPNTPVDSDLLFEVMIFIHSVKVASLQYLHLYRTVFWLPNSYTNQALNFYLIDIKLIVFIFVILSRRLFYILGCRILDKIMPEKIHEYCYMCYRFFLLGVMLAILSWCGYFLIGTTNPYINSFYLCYPITMYLLMFGFTITPFFDLINWDMGPTQPLHACTSNAREIRNEVENLKNSFNNRMKQVSFSSILHAYYAGFIPCYFSQQYLQYDVYWAGQHIVFIFFSCFMAYTLQLLPLKYCDTLHRATLHLGCWARAEGRSPVLPAAYTWQSDMLWPPGALVRHTRDIFRSQGECNAAEPGNVMYFRFYMMFKNPSVALGGLLIVHSIMVVFQLTLLIVKCVYWYHIISITFIIFCNYYLLFKLCRDYLVSVKIYKVEQAVRDKPSSH